MDSFHHGDICTFPDSPTITPIHGKIPKNVNSLSHTASFLHDSIAQNKPSSTGYLQFPNEGSLLEPDFRFIPPFTNTDRSFRTYEDLKQYVKTEIGIVKTQNILLFNLNWAMKLIEEYGEQLHQIVYYRPILRKDERMLAINVSNANVLHPGRLDVCECQNLLKCPNGTSTISRGAKSAEDCVESRDDIVRRVSLVTATDEKGVTNEPNQSRHGDFTRSDSFALESLYIEAYDIAIFDMSLSQLPRNMTYGEDYQLSVYKNCKPCPPRYRCKNQNACLSPSLDFQDKMLNDCLRRFKTPACVHRNGTNVDTQICRNTTNTTIDSYLSYSTPNIQKCLSMPFFCGKKSWNSLTFRKLCQDELPDGSKSPIYDCSLVGRWNHFLKWSEDICLAADNANDSRGCVQEACSIGLPPKNEHRKCLYSMFEKEFGSTPPHFEPQGSYIMDQILQEDSTNPDPFSLFNERNISSGHEEGTPGSHNYSDRENSATSMHTGGCCSCKPHPLPSFFETNQKASGFPDNKHHNISFTITALEPTEVNVVVELLNGEYYNLFRTYFVQESVLSHRVHSPRRFSRGSTSAQWLSIIKKETFQRAPMNLPMNLPMINAKRERFESSIIIDRPCKSLLSTVNASNHNASDDFGSRTITNEDSQQIVPYTYDDDGKFHDEDICVVDEFSNVHEETWWDSDTTDAKFSAIALPYLPFFSNCDGFDSHLSLSRLLEEHPNCTLVGYNETSQVRPISFSKENIPFGDYCMNQHPGDSSFKPFTDGADLQCQFEEQIDSASDHFRWYESKPESTLFFITPNAIPNDSFTMQYDQINGQPVPVTVSKNFGGLKNVIPREVTLDLQYYQVDRYTKRLVSATVFFNSFCTTLKPEHFGGDPATLNEMNEMDILPCNVDINGNLKSRGYALRIALYPLDWFNLLNKFQFHGSLYFGYFTLSGFASIVIGFTVWSLNRATTKLRHPPTFHGRALLKLIAEPSVFGAGLAIVALTCCCVVTFLTINPSSLFWEEISGDWHSNSRPDDDTIRMIRKGRTGTLLLVLGIYVTITSTSFIIRKRQTPEALHDDDEDLSMVSESNNAPESDSWTPIVWKRANFVQCCFALEFCLLCLWEFSYSPIFEANLHQIILFSKAVFVISEIAITKSLKEKLLCTPLLIAIGTTEVIITMGSSDFVDFTLLFFIQIFTGILHRLYIDPSVKSIQNLWPRWKFVLIQKLRPRVRMTVHQKRNENKKWRKINETIQLRNDGVEPLLDAITLSSIHIMVRVLVPIVFILISVFYSESEMAELYSVSATQVSYYALFTSCMIPWSLLIDVMVFNAQELVHGWRLYDYLVYQRHRFGSRDFKWSLNIPHFDESIMEALQSIDLMSFSSQYYFVSALLSGSIITTLFGATILLRTKGYSFLADPALPFIIIVIAMLVKFLRHAFIYLASIKIKYLDWEGIWGAIEIEGTLDDMIATKLAIGAGRQADLEKERMELDALNNDKFRQRFLDRNRPWLMRHLVELLTESEEDLTKEEKSTLIEYTKGVYSELLAMGEGDKRIGDRPDISSDDEDDSDIDKRRNWDRTTRNETSIDIAKLWLQKARKRHLFAKSINDLIKSNQRSACSSCSRGKRSCERLSVYICRYGRYDPTALDSLMNRFENEFPSSQNDILVWKSFFRQNAELLTLCNFCITQSITNIDETHIHTKRQTRPGDISSDEEDEETISFEPLAIDEFSSHGRLLQKWLIGARRKIGGPFPRPSAKLYTKTYIDGLKRKRGRQIKSASASSKTPTSKMNKENKWEPMKVEDSSKVIITKWLMMAKENNRERFLEQGQIIRRDLNNTLAQMEIIDDWYYSKDLRLEGLRLQRDASSLSKQQDQNFVQEAQTLKDVEKAKDAYIYDMECQMKRKEIKFEHRTAKLRSSHDTKTTLRVMELQSAIDDPSLEEGNRRRLEASIALENKRANKEWDIIANEVHEELGKQRSVIQREIRAKENETKLEAGFVRDRYKGECESKENEWKEMTMKWLMIAKSKVASKP